MRAIRKETSGQALVELALMMPMLLIFVLGIVDYTRALYYLEVTTNLSGEGSSSVSRSWATLSDTAVAVMADADIDMTHNGCVVITQVGLVSGAYTVVGQAVSNPCIQGTDPSRIGCLPPANGCRTATAVVPAAVQDYITRSANPNAYITEVFYNFSPITPVGGFLSGGALLPSQLYAVAYY